MEYEVLTAIIPLLIGGGLSLASAIGGAFSGGGSKSSKEGEKLRKTFLDEIETERGIARGGPSEARQGFDANKTAQESVAASGRLALPGFHDAIQDITGGAVGGGRLSTGFLGEDVERFSRKFLDRFGDIATSRSLEGSAQNLRNIEGGEATDFRNRGLFFDSLLGGLDMEQGRENAKQRSKGSFWNALGGIGGSLLGLGGFNPFASKQGGGSSSSQYSGHR